MTSNHNNQSELRRAIRKQRDALSIDYCMQAARQLFHNLSNNDLFRRSNHIGFYLAKGNELNIDSLIHLAWLQGKSAYLPVVTPHYMRKLWFAPYQPGTDLLANRYNIPEPVHDKQQRMTKIVRLDMILVPLVGFDRSGNRIGMGAGYYDRTLAVLRSRRNWLKPYLVGVAYDFQEIDNIPSNNWDVPLHAVATNREFIRCPAIK